MANYCFAEPEGRRALFAEACVRGWVAAVRDFPQRKSREECTAQALLECDTLRLEVCCITSEDAYQQLVSSAWVSTYLSLGDLTERETVPYAVELKGKSVDEALAIVRPNLSSNEGRAMIDKIYAQFLEATDGH